MCARKQSTVYNVNIMKIDTNNLKVGDVLVYDRDILKHKSRNYTFEITSIQTNGDVVAVKRNRGREVSHTTINQKLSNNELKMIQRFSPKYEWNPTQLIQTPPRPAPPIQNEFKVGDVLISNARAINGDNDEYLVNEAGAGTIIVDVYR